MANYMPIPRDLSKVKTKVALNLTKRQLICFGLGAAVGLPVFFLFKMMGVEISSCVSAMMVIMIPFFVLAIYEKNGQPLEVVLGNMIRAQFIRPKKRPYITRNYYRCLEEQAKLQREVRHIVRNNKEAGT